MSVSKLYKIIKFLAKNRKELYFFFKELHKKERIENFIKKKEDRERDLMVLVNGPSLNGSLDKIIDGREYEKNDLVVVNFMPNDSRFYIIRPKYLIISDPMFYDKPSQIERVESFYNNINKRITWDITLFTPYAYYKDLKWRKSRFVNPKIEVVPIHQVEPPEGRNDLACILAKKGLMGADFGSVLHHCIYVGMLLGYKKILLYGADHNFFDGLCVNNDNQVCRRTVHFYETDAPVSPLYHHYSGEKRPYTMSFFLWEYWRIFRGHATLRAIADYLDVKIINRTPGSMIDSYEREII